MTAKVIICLDGCAPDYLAGSETPNLDAIAREGFHTIGKAVVPTVTKSCFSQNSFPVRILASVNFCKSWFNKSRPITDILFDLFYFHLLIYVKRC